MGIKVISENTAERRERVKKNFLLIKPLLDEGYNYIYACMEVGLCNTRNVGGKRWFRDIVEYGESQGYLHINHTGTPSKFIREQNKGKDKI